MPRIWIASPHRYADLARLWLRSVMRDVAPALAAAGWEVRITIYRDSCPDTFRPEHFPGVTFEGAQARDFVEFYDSALAFDCDLLFFLDADLFILNGAAVVDRLVEFERPEVAGVALLQRGKLPGVYALLCRPEDYRAVGPDAMAACYEGLDAWPNAVNRGPGERAAVRLAALGKQVIDATAQAAPHIADFHGTTVIRASREMFAAVIGEAQFEALVARKRYFCMGAYDNMLLGWLYREVFDEPFAVGADGREMSGSLTPDTLRKILMGVDRADLRDYFRRSFDAMTRLAARENLTLPKDLLP